MKDINTGNFRQYCK